MTQVQTPAFGIHQQAYAGHVLVSDENLRIRQRDRPVGFDPGEAVHVDLVLIGAPVAVYRSTGNGAPGQDGGEHVSVAAAVEVEKKIGRVEVDVVVHIDEESGIPTSVSCEDVDIRRPHVQAPGGENR